MYKAWMTGIMRPRGPFLAQFSLVGLYILCNSKFLETPQMFHCRHFCNYLSTKTVRAVSLGKFISFHDTNFCMPQGNENKFATAAALLILPVENYK
jgi:hypothetical protein